MNTVTWFMDHDEDANLWFLYSNQVFNVIYHQFLSAKLATLGVPPKVAGWVKNC